MRKIILSGFLLIGLFCFAEYAVGQKPKQKISLTKADSFQRYTAAALLQAWGNSKRWSEGADKNHWQIVSSVLDSNSMSAPAVPARVTELMRKNGLGGEHDRIYRPMMRFKPAMPLLDSQDAIGAMFVDSLIQRLQPSDRADIPADFVKEIWESLNASSNLERKPVVETDTYSKSKAVVDTGFIVEADESPSRLSRIMKRIHADKFNWPFALLLLLGIGLVLWLIRRHMHRQREEEREGEREMQRKENERQWEKMRRDEEQRRSQNNDNNATNTGTVVSTTNSSGQFGERQTLEPINNTTTVSEANSVAVSSTPKQEVFYMTVPSTDGTFPTGAKKTSKVGCLYRFEVNLANSNLAQVSFCGTESDMRNAQAFRDLELLPVCEFIGLPNINTFRFTQEQEGRAVFNGEVWQVKEKIRIKFIP